MKIIHRKHSETGGTFIIAMITILILTFAAADICYKAVQRYRYTMQSSSWTESLNVAEGGADQAMAALNNNTWTNWTTNSGTAAPTGVPGSSGTNTLAATLTHLYAGEDSRNAAVKVTIDAPASLNGSTGQWYRIRSVGTTGLPHTGTIGQEPSLTDSNGNKVGHAYMLRKFSFSSDITSGRVATPQVSRTVEVLAQPVAAGPFSLALTMNTLVNLSGGSYIDSFDSSNTTLFPGGIYNSTNRQSNASVGLLHGVSDSHNNLGNDYVYGTVAYSRVAPTGTSNVTGGVTTPFTKTVATPTDPTWTATSALTTIIGGGPHTDNVAGSQKFVDARETQHTHRIGRGPLDSGGVGHRAKLCPDMGER